MNEPDLERRSDVHDAVVSFYRAVVFDDLLGPVFDEVAEVDWSTHIPTLIDYWCRVLFGEPAYVGSILGPHRAVSELEPFHSALFDRWYALWVEALDQQWAGPNAERAKAHAAKMGGVLARQLTGSSWRPEPVVGSPR